MASFINTNMASLNTQNNLTKSQGALNQSIQRLSSGLRVNGAKDDAAGLAIANGMDSKIRGQNVAIRNANDAFSFSQTAEGALSNVNDNLQRMRELAVQAANATNSTDDRASLNTEFAQLQAEITRVGSATKFNGISVLNGASQKFQIGSGTETTVDDISISGVDVTSATSSTGYAAAAIGTSGTPTVTTATTGQNIFTADNATTAITAIDLALKEVSTETIKHGANQNRFAAVVATLQTSVENQTQARSRIMDTDYAAETAVMARGQILQQAGMAMLAQANQLPNGVMALMR